MRILHFIWSLRGTGGAEKMLIDLANVQAQHDDVTVIVGNSPVSNQLIAAFDTTVSVHCLNRPPHSRNPLHLLRLWRKVWGCRPDIIHSHSESFAAAMPFLPAPAVVTVHGTKDGILRRLGRYKRVFAVSRSVAELIRRECRSVKPTVVYNGVHSDQIRTGPPPPDSPFRIVQVGRLVAENKGQDLVLTAVGKLRDHYGVRDLEVEFIGSGPSRQELQSLADQLSLTDCVRFSEDLDRKRIYDKLWTYNLLIQPSRWEGFGLTVVEAMIAGIPVLVSDSEGPMEVIANGEHGAFFRTGDATSCAELIRTVRQRAKLPSWTIRLQAAREYARSRFDISVTAGRYTDQYRQLLARDVPIWRAAESMALGTDIARFTHKGERLTGREANGGQRARGSA